MTIKRKSNWVNTKGQKAHPGLEPPDLNQCQARPNMVKWSPFTLGPKPEPIRCTNQPVFVAVENAPRADGKVGSMSLCLSCRQLLSSNASRTFAKIHPILPEDRLAKR